MTDEYGCRKQVTGRGGVGGGEGEGRGRGGRVNKGYNIFISVFCCCCLFDAHENEYLTHQTYKRSKVDVESECVK